MEEFFSRYASTLVGVAVILIWFFVWGLRDFKNSIEKDPFGDYEEPRMAATFGVLGTFGGIVWGLLSFDPSPDTMQHSVENLLNGMQTAFVTSIFGMVLSIILKYWQKNKQENFKSTATKYEATITDLIEYLKSNSKNNSEDERRLSAAMEKLTAALAKTDKSDNEQKILAALEKLTVSLVGDGDYTVIGQLKTLRLEMRDNNDRILQQFQEFGKTLAENNSKAFIEALNETMKDFNTKLTEQFGENFKQLNFAVGNLLEWQKNYIRTIETATQNLETAFIGIDDAKNSLAQISNTSAEIKNTAASIQDLIVTANLYEQKLATVLSEVGTLGDSAKNSVPQIINFVKTSCNEIEKSVKMTTNNLNTLSTNISNTTNRISQIGSTAFSKIEEISNKTIQSMQEVSKRIESTSHKQREIMDTEVKATKDAVTSAAITLREDTFKISKSLEQMMKTNNENLQKSSENLNKNLERTLKQSLDKFGDTMWKVSEKFVKDYTPLTEKLKSLIDISRGVERRRPY